MEEIVTGKEGIKVNREEHLKNLTREVEQTTKQLIDVEDMKSMLEEERALVNANFEIAFKNFFMLKPNWAFEEIPQYMENVKKINKITAKRRDMQFDIEIKRIDGNVESLKSQLESLSNEKDRVEKTLKGD